MRDKNVSCSFLPPLAPDPSDASRHWQPTRPRTTRGTWSILYRVKYRLNAYGRRDFSVAGPTVWNFIPDFIRDPTICADCFRRLLTAYAFVCLILAHSAR